MPARGAAEQGISAVMRARRSRSQHARRWERGRLARMPTAREKTYPFELPLSRPLHHHRRPRRRLRRPHRLRRRC